LQFLLFLIESFFRVSMEVVHCAQQNCTTMEKQLLAPTPSVIQFHRRSILPKIVEDDDYEDHDNDEDHDDEEAIDLNKW
jgi:hypothetical protein